MGNGARWIVDGMNVIGSRPDGWWRDRPAAMRALASQLAAWAQGRDLTVVFDGRPLDVEADGIEVLFAGHSGRNAADDDIVTLVESDPDPATLRVVTSDSELSERVTERGAEVVPAGSFRRLLG